MSPIKKRTFCDSVVNTLPCLPICARKNRYMYTENRIMTARRHKIRTSVTPAGRVSTNSYVRQL